MKRKRFVASPAPRRGKPEAPARGVLERLASLAFGEANRWLGAMWLVISCGLLLLWWVSLQQWWQIRAVGSAVTESTEARLVDRYYRLSPRYESGEADPQRCGGQCLIRMAAVAVLEFTPPAGAVQRIEFVDHGVHEPGVETELERAIPITSPAVRLTRDFQETLRNQRSISKAEVSLWDEWWERFDDSALWMARTRASAPEIRVPIRFDPDTPSVAVLDLPSMRVQRERDLDQAQSFVLKLLPFTLIFCVMVLHPSLALVLGTSTRRARIATTVAVVLSVPLWAPFAMLLAGWLSSTAGRIAEVLAHDFEPDWPPVWLAEPVSPGQDMAEHRWSLIVSEDGYFLQGLNWVPPQLDPGAHEAAYDQVRESLSAALLAMADAPRAELIERLNHYRAGGALELLAPALVTLSADAQGGPEEPSTVEKVLHFHFGQWPMPERGHVLAAHRVAAFERIAQRAGPAFSAIAQRRVAQWRQGRR